MERTNSGLFLLFVFVILALYLMPFYPEKGTANELIDWATSVSLVENNSVDIGRAEKLSGAHFDAGIVRKDDSVYSTKAPGLALLGAPIYAITRLFLGPPTSENIRTSWFVLKSAIGAFPLLCLGIWLYGREIDSYSLAILLFATPLFPYSLFLYSHVLAAILVYIAFRILWDPPRLNPDICFSGAFLLGIAVLFEYAAIIPLIVIWAAVLVMGQREKARCLIFFFAGILPGLVGIFVYSLLVFGSPIEFLMHTGFALPTLSAIFQYSLRPSHGLLTFSPILILGLFSLFSSQELGTPRHNIKILLILAIFFGVCGIGAASNIDAIGPRHMILLIPLLLDSIFDGEIEEYPSHWRGMFFAISLVFCTLPLFTQPFAPVELIYPHNSFWMPLLYESNVFGLSIVNTFGIALSFWTILPAIVLVVIVLATVWRDSKYPVPFALGIVSGLGIAAAYMLAFVLEKAP